MKHIKKNFLILILIVSSFVSVHKKTYAFFGIENIALAKILIENVKQLIELKKIVETGQDSFKLLDDINRGIHDALNLLETVNKAIHPGTFYKIKDISDINSVISELYGVIPHDLDAPVLKVHDMTVAESFQMHNQLYDYAKQLDKSGEAMKRDANTASPGRAQKLSAQNQGVILQALSQLQRNQAQIIKLLAQNVAMKNQQEKRRARGHRQKYAGLKDAFNTLNGNYQLPTLK